MVSEFRMGSVIAVTAIDCKEIQTRIATLNQLVKKIWPTNKTGQIWKILMVQNTKQGKWSNKVKWNKTFIINQFDETDLSGCLITVAKVLHFLTVFLTDEWDISVQNMLKVIGSLNLLFQPVKIQIVK